MVKCAGCSRESSHSPGKVANIDPGDGGMEKLRRTTHDAHRVARTTPLGLEGYLCHAASLDADCWQDPLGSDAVAQSYLARGALCDATRADHLANPLRDRTFELEFDFLDSLEGFPKDWKTRPSNCTRYGSATRARLYFTDGRLAYTSHVTPARPVHSSAAKSGLGNDWRFAAGLQLDVFAPGLPTVFAPSGYGLDDTVEFPDTTLRLSAFVHRRAPRSSKRPIASAAALSRQGFLRRGRGAPGIHHRPQRAVLPPFSGLVFQSLGKPSRE